jgi:hypothetical protein
MSRRKLLGRALEFPPDLGTHVESEEYYLQKAADMERFAREAWTVVYYDMFTTAAENYRALAREAAMLKPKAPAAAEQ